MSKKVAIFAAVVLVFVLSNFAGVPEVADVVAKQRDTWSGLVEITCNLNGVDGKYRFFVEVGLADSSKFQLAKSLVLIKQDGGKTNDLSVAANGAYRLLWNAKADLGAVEHENMVVRVSVDRDKVQLWEGGPYWATTNIGAEKPEDYGYYFWWGDTVGYKRENGKWVASDGSNLDFSFTEANAPTYGKSILTLKNEGWITSSGVLVPKHDAAQARWGGNWRMPTEQEAEGLKTNCTWTLTTTNGIDGYIVRGKNDYASNSVFIPCSGCGWTTSLINLGDNARAYYWTSAPKSNDQTYAACFYYESNKLRHYGMPIRPLQDESGVTGSACESAAFSLDAVDVLGEGFELPDLGSGATAEQISRVTLSFADARVAQYVSDAAGYEAFCAWVSGLSGVELLQVMESPYSWLSYALDADELIATAIKEGDVVIDTVETAATGGAFGFTVKIDGIDVGEGALEANLKKVFAIEGVEDLGDGTFSAENVEISAAKPENGKIRFLVTPKGGKSAKFFFKVKMN